MKEQKKEEKKDNKYPILIFMLLLITISIGYAVLSKNYIFNGFINIKGNMWDLVPPKSEDIIEEPTNPDKAPEVETDPETGNVTIKYYATLEKPGDEYSLVLPIKNNGTMDALLQSVTTTPLTAEQQKYLTYTITAADGSKLQGKNIVSKGEPLKVKILIRYRVEDAENIPKEDITNIELKTILNFVQKN